MSKKTITLNELQDFIFNQSMPFELLSLHFFAMQQKLNPVYLEYISHLFSDQTTPSIYTAHNFCINDKLVFLPLQLFKKHKITTYEHSFFEAIFKSSATTGSEVSQHYVAHIDIYIKSFMRTFKNFYGNVQEYCILGLLPSYLERSDSSLVYMVQHLIEESNHLDSGFYMYNHAELAQKLEKLEAVGQKTLLIGVSFALLDFAEQYKIPLKNTIVMETGGMKGKRKEITRPELHQLLKDAFNVQNIHSEYGMTELLSQAYSKGNGIFECPPWMRAVPRQINDPLAPANYGETCALNFVDLANMFSCSFIATDDIGKVYENGTFEVLGRMDNTDIRGCNLMA